MQPSLSFLFVGNRLEVLNALLEQGLRVRILLENGCFATRALEGKEAFSTFSSKAELLTLIESTPFDIFISNGCPYILPISRLRQPHQTFINCHPSLLPNLKGAHPINGALLFNQPSGASCHIMSDEVDSGEVISQVPVGNTPNTPLPLLYQMCFLAEKQAFLEALARDFMPMRPQPTSAPIPYYTRHPSDMELDFSAHSTRHIIQTIRAFSSHSQRARIVHKGEYFYFTDALLVKNTFLSQQFEARAINDICLRYENHILCKREEGFLQLSGENLDGLPDSLSFNSPLGRCGHSALSDKSAIKPHYFGDRFHTLSPRASAQSPDLSSQILECQDSATLNPNAYSEFTLSDSHSISESTPCHSEQSKESTNHASRDISVFCSQYDKRLESASRANPECPTDSERAQAVGHSSTAIESSFSSKRCLEQALKASSGWGIVKGEGATSQFKPLPLNKKENIESKEVNQTLEAKAKDSKAIESEPLKIQKAKAGDSEKQYLESSDFTSPDSKTSSIALSQKEKGCSPLPALPSPEKNKASAFSFRQMGRVPRFSASSSSVAAALLPPCFNASAPDSLRDSVCASRDLILSRWSETPPLGSSEPLEEACLSAETKSESTHDSNTPIFATRAYLSALEPRDSRHFHFSYQEGGKHFSNAAILEPLPRTPTPTARYDISSPYGYAGYLSNSDDEGFLRRALSAQSLEARERGIIAEFVRFHPLLEASRFAPLLDMFACEREIVAVSSDFEARWSAYSSRLRGKLRKSLDTLEVRASSDLERFSALYTQTMQRNKASAFYFFAPAYFRALLALPHSVLLEARYRNEVCAMGLFLFDSLCGYYHLGANAPITLDKNLNAMGALFERFFQIAYDKGIARCILGGGRSGAAEDSLFMFKKQFATQILPFYIGGKIYDTAAYAALRAANQSRYFLSYRFENTESAHFSRVSANLTGGGAVVIFFGRALPYARPTRTLRALSQGHFSSPSIQRRKGVNLSHARPAPAFKLARRAFTLASLMSRPATSRRALQGAAYA